MSAHNSQTNEVYEIVKIALGARGRYAWSNLRVIVSEDSADGHTVSLQPVTQVKVTDQDGQTSNLSLPLLLDVPISFKGGGGVTETHMIKKGDEGVASFSSSPIDTWHQQGGVQAQIDGRMHSLSDATFHPGGRSDPRKLADVSTSSHQTRSDDGSHLFDLHPKNGVTHQSTNMVLSQVGDKTAHVLTKDGIKASGKKILWNC